MKIKTKDLQNLIPTIRSVVGNYELQPKSTMLGIKTTTDSLVFYAIGRDKLKIGLKVENPDQGIDLAVNANQFLSLIDKTTTEDIEISLDSSSQNVIVKGNGVYNIAKMICEIGDVTFDDINTTNLTNSLGSITKDFIRTIIVNNTYATLKIKESESQGRMSTGNYHINTDKTMTSDGDVICKTVQNSGLNADISLTPITINTLKIVNSDLTVYNVGNDLYFTGTDVVIVSPKVLDASEFPFQALDDQLKDELYDTTVFVEKAPILAAMERLSIFNIDNSPIEITLNNGSAIFKIKEQIENVIISGDGKGFVFVADPLKFTSSIKAINVDSITMKFNVNNKNLLRLDGTNLIEAISSRS